MKRYKQLREMPYNNEYTWNERTNLPYPRLTVGIDRRDPDGAVTIMQVRNGVNYLCDDYRGPFADRNDKQLIEMAKQLVTAVGVDRIRPHYYTEENGHTKVHVGKDIHITEWANAPELCSALRFSRFLNRDGQQLFQVRNGQRIIENYADGSRLVKDVQTVDDTHFYVGSRFCHIQQYANQCFKRGCYVEPEHPQPGDKLDRMLIYQIPHYTCEYRFTDYDYAQNKLKATDYRCAYVANMPRDYTPDKCFRDFNYDDRPCANSMPSLSVSDLIVMERSDKAEVLFSDAVRRWLEDVRHRVDEVTYQGYEVQARAHILPYFDDLQIRLCDVDGETLQTYINVKAKFGRSDGHGGLSAVSLRQHKNVLNQTLKLAQRDGLIQTNPADLVVMPHAAQFTGTFYTEAQMRDLLTAVKNERLYPIIYVTALYGLRRSEVLGLKWDSINFAMQTLTIRHTVARVTKVVEKNKTKNASSFRSFPLTDDAVRLFKILLQQEQYYRNHFGKDYIDNDYVFTWEDGHPYSPDYVSHTFHKLLKKCDLPHIRFHDLRHTCASMLLSEGYGLKDVQEWLGHSDIKMTANIYGHLDIRRKRSIANGLEQALPRLKP